MSAVVSRIAAAIALVALLAVGIWFFGAVLATSTVAAIALSGGWLVACAVLAELAARRRPRLRWTLRGTLAVFAAAEPVRLLLDVRARDGRRRADRRGRPGEQGAAAALRPARPAAAAVVRSRGDAGTSGGAATIAELRVRLERDRAER